MIKSSKVKQDKERKGYKFRLIVPNGEIERHAGVFAVSAEVQPGARHVAAMRERLKAAGPSCVFSEPPLRPRLAQTLSDGLPVRLAELDALGFDLPAQAGSYEQLLERLGAGLAGCLEQL